MVGQEYHDAPPPLPLIGALTKLSAHCFGRFAKGGNGGVVPCAFYLKRDGASLYTISSEKPFRRRRIGHSGKGVLGAILLREPSSEGRHTGSKLRTSFLAALGHTLGHTLSHALRPAFGQTLLLSIKANVLHQVSYGHHGAHPLSVLIGCGNLGIHSSNEPVAWGHGTLSKVF